MKKKNWYQGLSLADDQYIAEAHPSRIIKPQRNKIFMKRLLQNVYSFTIITLVGIKIYVLE